MQLKADKIYQGTSQINLGTGPGRPWCRYATEHNVGVLLIVKSSFLTVILSALMESHSSYIDGILYRNGIRNSHSIAFRAGARIFRWSG